MSRNNQLKGNSIGKYNIIFYFPVITYCKTLQIHFILSLQQMYDRLQNFLFGTQTKIEKLSGR